MLLSSSPPLLSSALSSVVGSVVGGVPVVGVSVVEGEVGPVPEVSVGEPEVGVSAVEPALPSSAGVEPPSSPHPFAAKAPANTTAQPNLESMSMGYHERGLGRYAGAHVVSAVIYVGLGSNRGDRLSLIRSATNALRQHDGLQLRATSPIFETRPVGPSEGAFLNAALSATTSLSPHAILDVLLEIERAHGRVRTTRWAARTLDLDLLAYVIPPAHASVQIADERLTLPHPHLCERDFVLEPLCALAPTVRLGSATVATHLAALPEAARTIVQRWAEELQPQASPGIGAVVDPTTSRG